MAVLEIARWLPAKRESAQSFQKPVWRHLLEMVAISALYGTTVYGGAHLIRQSEQVNVVGPFLFTPRCTDHGNPARHVDLTITPAERKVITEPYTIVAVDYNGGVGDIKYVNTHKDIPVTIHFLGFLRGGDYDLVVLSGRVLQLEARTALSQSERIIGRMRIDQSCLSR